MSLNKIIKVRISTEMDNELTRVSEEIGFTKINLIRLLISRSLKQLRADAAKVNGLQNLEFSLR